MPNLVDIPTVVGSLVMFFASGGTEAALEAIKGITVNGALKLAELKDQLLTQPEVQQSVARLQQNPLDREAKTGLERVLTSALEKHSVFQQTAVQVRGDVKAKEGGIAAAVISGHVTVNNARHGDD